MSCKHERVINISAKADDRQTHSVPHLSIDRTGYAPCIDGVCHGDYLELTICLDCGSLVGFESISDTEIYEAFDIDAELDETRRPVELLDRMGR